MEFTDKQQNSRRICYGNGCAAAWNNFGWNWLQYSS